LDGFETTFQANHLGHFLLTDLLVEKLVSSAPSRIVVISSALHDPANSGPGKGYKVNWDDFGFDKTAYDAGVAYRISKYANLLFTFELNRRLKGTGVSVNAMHPGLIPATNLGRDFPWLIRKALLLVPGTRTLDNGGDMIVDLSTKTGNEYEEGGHYFAPDGAKSSTDTQNEEYQKKLWELSALWVAEKSKN